MRIKTVVLTDGRVWLRVASASWKNPLDSNYAQQAGGRWNPPGAYPALYLNADLATARSQLERMLEGYPVGIDDLDEDAFVLSRCSTPKAAALCRCGQRCRPESARATWRLSAGCEGRGNSAFALSARWSSRPGPAIARNMVPIRRNARRTRTRARVVSLQRTIKSPPAMEASVTFGGMVVRASMVGYRIGRSGRPALIDTVASPRRGATPYRHGSPIPSTSSIGDHVTLALETTV